MLGFTEKLPHILGGGDGDDNGGPCDANEEHNFEQTHGEENDRHGGSVPRTRPPSRWTSVCSSAGGEIPGFTG